MYLLDANVFIYAQRDYYPPERVPEYWSWLAHQADIENIKVPAPIWDEIKPGVSKNGLHNSIFMTGIWTS